MGILDTIGQGLTQAGNAVQPFAQSFAAGFAGETPAQQQEAALRGQEVQQQQQRLAIEAQQHDLEMKKAQIAFQNEANRQTYAQSIQDPTQRQMYLESPEQYFKTTAWKNTASIFSRDPAFQQAHPLLAKMLPNLDPENGSKALDAILTKNYTGRTEPYQRGGKSYMTLYNPANPSDSMEIEIPGTPQQQIIKETAAPAKPIKPPSASTLQSLATATYNDAVSTTKTGYLGTTVGAPDTDRKATAHSAYVDKLMQTYGMDSDTAEANAQKYVDTKFPSPSDKLRAKGRRPATTGGGSIPPPPAGFTVHGG